MILSRLLKHLYLVRGNTSVPNHGIQLITAIFNLMVPGQETFESLSAEILKVPSCSRGLVLTSESYSDLGRNIPTLPLSSSLIAVSKMSLMLVSGIVWKRTMAEARRTNTGASNHI